MIWLMASSRASAPGALLDLAARLLVVLVDDALADGAQERVADVPDPVEPDARTRPGPVDGAGGAPAVGPGRRRAASVVASRRRIRPETMRL